VKNCKCKKVALKSIHSIMFMQRKMLKMSSVNTCIDFVNPILLASELMHNYRLYNIGRFSEQCVIILEDIFIINAHCIVVLYCVYQWPNN